VFPRQFSGRGFIPITDYDFISIRAKEARKPIAHPAGSADHSRYGHESIAAPIALIALGIWALGNETASRKNSG
jgi:hypothetical protein